MKRRGLQDVLPLTPLQEGYADEGPYTVLPAESVAELLSWLQRYPIGESIGTVGENVGVTETQVRDATHNFDEGGVGERMWCVAGESPGSVEDLGLSAADVVVHNALVTSDVAVWQMLAALVVGGQVRVLEVPLTRNGKLDGALPAPNLTAGPIGDRDRVHFQQLRPTGYWPGLRIERVTPEPSAAMAQHADAIRADPTWLPVGLAS
jgi:hypothetical protein